MSGILFFTKTANHFKNDYVVAVSIIYFTVVFNSVAKFLLHIILVVYMKCEYIYDRKNIISVHTWLEV